MIKTKKLFLLLAMLLMSIGASAQSQLKGDVNNDGKVDEADITAVIEIMKNGGGVTDSNDVNKDGKVDVADIVAIIGIIKNGGGSSGETKYYWYAGPDMLTSATVPGSGTVYPMTTTSDSQTGWHVIEGEPTSIETGDLANPEKINWVLAIPTKFGLNHISNGEDVTDAYDVTTVICADGVEYIVFKQLRATKRIDVTFVKGSTSGEVFDPNSYYIYIGLNRPTSDTDIAADLASNNTPLYDDTAPMGWRSVGDDISIYNSSNPAYRGSSSSNAVVLDKNFNDVLCYVAIPVGMGIYMDDGGIRDCGYFSLDQAGVTIKGHKYNIYKSTLEGEFTDWIYFPNKKYYCYVGNEMPTASTDPTTTEGWTVLPYKPKEINVCKEAPNGNNVQWYIAAPAGWNFETTDNGSIVGGWTKTTVTIDGVPYNVWTRQALANTANTTLANMEKSGKEEYDPNSYYIYIGLNRPTSDTDIAADLASNNTPLYEGYEAAGWRNVGQYPGYYSYSYPAFAGGRETVILDKDFNDVLTYIVLPKGMSIYAGLGNEVIGGLELDQENITIQGHQYNVYKGIFGGEFGLVIF